MVTNTNMIVIWSVFQFMNVVNIGKGTYSFQVSSMSDYLHAVVSEIIG